MYERQNTQTLLHVSQTPFFRGSLDAAIHHGPEAAGHHVAGLRAVYRDNHLEMVFDDIERGSDGLGLNHATLTNFTIMSTDKCNLCLRDDTPEILDGRVEMVVTLGCKSKNCKSTACALLCPGLVGITEELSNGEFAAFDPEACALADESNE